MGRVLRWPRPERCLERADRRAPRDCDADGILRAPTHDDFYGSRNGHAIADASPDTRRGDPARPPEPGFVR